MVHAGVVKVLLIEDDEDDFLIARDLLGEIRGSQFTLDWARTYEEGWERLMRNQHDICLVDYRLGPRNGIELLRAAAEGGCQSPIILLTGLGEHQVDVEAMQAGAADYLVKAQLRADSLERSIRYALQRKRAAALAAFDQARLAAFGVEVGQAVAGRDSLDALLNRCAKAMAQFLNAGLAQVATLDAEKRELVTRAVAGPLANGFESPAKAPAVRLNLDALAAGKPVLLHLLGRPDQVDDPAWARREGVCAYAAYPLVLEDKLVGVMSLFSQQALSEQILQEMSSVANVIALCIQRKLSQEALDRIEVKYRAVVESIKEVIFQLDEFGHWVVLNPAWTAVTGFEVKPTLGMFFLDYFFQADKEQNRQIFLKLMERSLPFCRYETRLYTRNGQVRWVEIYLQTLLDPHGNILGISGSLSDINDRKTAEIQIEKLAAFPQVNPNPVLEFGADGRMTYANEAARELARKLGREELLAILPPEPAAIVRECLATGQRKLQQEVTVEKRILTWSFFPISTNQVVHCYGADVTEIQNLEAQLRHSQKLESVGQLAAGVAHDFNNILTVIQGYSECLLNRGTLDEAAAGALKQISLASHRAAGLTRQLLTFSRKQVIQPRALDLNSVLKNLLSMLGRLVGEDIALENEYGPDLPVIEADTGMIEQVVMNLAVNSRDAMPQGGRLRIATEAVELSADDASRNAESRPGSFVRLTVADTGCGMDARTRERMFEPFFTTKGVGKGTGLGLATVYGIVKQHKGWIEVATQPGRGTTFTIYFPTAAPDTAFLALAPPALDDVARGRRETVFLVEDDPVLRDYVHEVLEQCDYRVVEAASGVEALRTWDEIDGEVDVLLTDVVMPNGVNGLELASRLKQRRPDLKVIFSSGYSEDMVGNNFDLQTAWFLPKPYNPQQLAQIVRHCLDAAAGSVNPAVPVRGRETAAPAVAELVGAS